MFRALLAEWLGSFFVIFIGLGAAVLTAPLPEIGIGYGGIALAFGLAQMSAMLALGQVSGGHFNPVLSLGATIGGHLPRNRLLPYWAAQSLGALAGAGTIYLIASGTPGFVAGGFAANGYGINSPGGYGLTSAVIAEMTGAAMLALVFLSACWRESRIAAPLAVGGALIAIHLVLLPVTGTGVNPARSLVAALFAQTEALGQVWIFLLAPLAGGALGAAIWRLLLRPEESPAGRRG
ncbi:aquaporin Z [Devosia enhydra]|uniref:Aquaporin Z n=1 Tax=Devosia enhydra TaxID=665118 RepID=A0A1K2I2Z9_9HYPH|nr:aquaporin [Devosia enhydra]SFZ86766.1 aquaporin Z [Devosia enhydra]